MGMGFAPTWLRQVSPPASQNHFNHCYTYDVFIDDVCGLCVCVHSKGGSCTSCAVCNARPGDTTTRHIKHQFGSSSGPAASHQNDVKHSNRFHSGRRHRLPLSAR